MECICRKQDEINNVYINYKRIKSMNSALFLDPSIKILVSIEII